MIRNIPERIEADPQMFYPIGMRRDAMVTQRTHKWFCLLALATVMVSGCAAGLRATCAPYEELKRRAVVKATASKQAKAIWEDCYADQYQDKHCEADAEHGFRTAYVETALGTPDAPPPVPVRPCISRHSLTHTYPDANAWYDGYHHGRAAALSRGVDRWRLAPLDPGLICPTECCPDQTFANPYDNSSVVDGQVIYEGIPIENETTIEESLLEPHDGGDADAIRSEPDSLPSQPATETNMVPELTNLFLRS
ncbi:hypothetical protein Q31b_18950 [Novipirellula aureliae]|uniref:Uncharacterized protein n=1 Tax=Novipirellula aureliae TaxID=2527966 RepID=A0A5C6EB14_9BACT|nr:hypothetical protein [Novipirellula aureliae]TWU44359.1 hypothetical protein Q31b_18950 [Novipirellula aureliae]